MNSKVICVLVVVASVFATGHASYVPLVYSSRLALTPSYHETHVPVYNYYRVANLPADRYPPGVDHVKCPNYPYCGTAAGSLVVPPVAPTLSHARYIIA